jgi:hypothetical protein
MIFDGTIDRPLLLWPLPIGSSLPGPRLFAKTASTGGAGQATQDREALAEVEAGGRAEAEERGRFTGAGSSRS